MDEGLAIRGDFENRHSFAFTGACALAGAAVGAIWTGAAAGARFGAAGCFLAAAKVGEVAAAGGRGAGTGAAEAATGGLAVAGPGSGVMMLTGGGGDALGD